MVRQRLERQPPRWPKAEAPKAGSCGDQEKARCGALSSEPQRACLPRSVMGLDDRYACRIVRSMVKVSIFYPSKPDSRFDVDYYLNTHMPLAIGLLGSAVKAVSVEIGMFGGTPDQQ